MADKKTVVRRKPVRPTEAQLFSGKPLRRARFEKAEYAMEAARLIRLMREEAGIDQRELARRLGVSQPRVSTLEKGGGAEGPGYAMLRMVAEACGVDWRDPIGHVLQQGAGNAEAAS